MHQFKIWMIGILVVIAAWHHALAFSDEALPEFVLYTQPKTGTYLMTPLLTALTGKHQQFSSKNFTLLPFKEEMRYQKWLSSTKFVPVYMHHTFVKNDSFISVLDELKKTNKYFACHTPYSVGLDELLGKRNCIVFFVLRDPRDYIVSGARFYGKGDQCIFPKDWYQSLSFNDQLTVMIHGTDWYNSARWMISAFKNWIYSANVCLIRFEDLVSPDDEQKLRELRKMTDVLSISITDEELIEIFDSVYGKGPTFKTGVSGKWKQYFTEEHKQICKECIGDLLIELGYEKDLNW